MGRTTGSSAEVTMLVSPAFLRTGGRRRLRLAKFGGPKQLWVKVPPQTDPDARLRLRGVSFDDGPVDLFIRFERRNDELGIGLLMVAIGAVLIALFFWMGVGYPTTGAMLGMLGAYTAATGHFPIRAYDNSWREVSVVMLIVLIAFGFKACLAAEFDVR